MTNLSEIGGLYQSTPANLKDARTKAFMYACDKQIAKLLERSKKTMVWCAIEDVDEKYLDLLAADCRALFYNSSLSADVKRKLIANSQYWYMKLGISAAMEEMINIVFSNNETTVEEWFTYAGDAFHFRIATSSKVTTIEMTEFLKYINEVKNARSIFDYLVLQSGSTIILENDSDTFHVSFEPCGEDSFCGTNPNQAVGLAIAESILEMTEGGDVFQTEYEPTGTTPDYAMGLQLSESEMLLENSSQETLFDYNMDNQTESGTFPNYAMAAQFADEVVELAESSTETAFEYPVDNKFASEDV